jgi:hypothetical protein
MRGHQEEAREGTGEGGEGGGRRGQGKEGRRGLTRYPVRVASLASPASLALRTYMYARKLTQKIRPAHAMFQRLPGALSV